MKWLIIVFLIPTLLFSQIPSGEDDEYDKNEEHFTSGHEDAPGVDELFTL